MNLSADLDPAGPNDFAERRYSLLLLPRPGQPHADEAVLPEQAVLPARFQQVLSPEYRSMNLRLLQFLRDQLPAEGVAWLASSLYQSLFLQPLCQPLPVQDAMPIVFWPHLARRAADTSPHSPPDQATAAHSLGHSPDQKRAGLPLASAGVPVHYRRQIFLPPTVHEDSLISGEAMQLRLQSPQDDPLRAFPFLRQVVGQPVQAAQGVVAPHRFHSEHFATPLQCDSSPRPSSQWPYPAESGRQYTDGTTLPQPQVPSR